jgi:hypothetical protein
MQGGPAVKWISIDVAFPWVSTLNVGIAHINGITNFRITWSCIAPDYRIDDGREGITYNSATIKR